MLPGQEGGDASGFGGSRLYGGTVRNVADVPGSRTPVALGRRTPPRSAQQTLSDVGARYREHSPSLSTATSRPLVNGGQGQVQGPGQAHMEAQGQGQQSRIICGQCGCLLAYPRGARYIQCGGCQVLNQAPTPVMQHVQCIGCQQLLMCPAGAQRVRCASCGTITGTRQDGPRFTYTACCGCGVMLMHAAGAARVQCAVCGVLTATGGEGPVGDNPSKGSPVKAVFVEQPGGTEMALGIHKLS